MALGKWELSYTLSNAKVNEFLATCLADEDYESTAKKINQLAELEISGSEQFLRRSLTLARIFKFRKHYWTEDTNFDIFLSILTSRTADK